MKEEGAAARALAQKRGGRLQFTQKLGEAEVVPAHAFAPIFDN